MHAEILKTAKIKRESQSKAHQNAKKGRGVIIRLAPIESSLGPGQGNDLLVEEPPDVSHGDSFYDLFPH